MVVSAALMVTVAAVLSALLVSIGQVDRARAARVKTDAVVQADLKVQKAVLDMETGLRGFELTHDRRFLAPWYEGRAAFGRNFSKLHALTGSDASGDDQEITEIGREGSAYIKLYGDPLLRSGMRPGRVRASLSEGKQRVDSLRALFQRVTVINEGQAAQLFADATAATSRARGVALAGLSLLLLLVGLGALYLVRRVSWPIRRVADAAGSIDRGDLSIRAPVNGPGEVLLLGRSFNSMAASIEDGLSTVRAQNVALEHARSEAERTSAELEAQQELAVDLIATAGFDGYFKRLNPAWRRTLGFSEEELRSRPFIEFVHPDDLERTAAEAARLSEGGVDLISFENRYRTKDGSYRWLEWNVRPLADRELLFAVARDVTERKQADLEIRAARDEADRANLAKSEFLSRMSHELRTPMNAVLGFGQLLAMDELTSRQQESVEQIMRGGAHLLGLIDEVLDITRIDSGTISLSLEPVDLASTLADAVGLIAPVAAQRSVTVSSEVAAGSEIYVTADRQRVRQVILNLLSNAVKYNREGGAVRLSVIAVGDRVRVAVADTGQGVAVDKLERLFEPFDRLDAEQSDVQGTGLGLALSRNLAEQMNGTLTVASTVGKGSVFTLELARAPNPVGDDRMSAARKAGREGVGVGARTLLYIEDNPSNFRLVEQLFSEQPEVRVMPAQQGGVGLDLARTHHPDLVLLDLHLPDMGGAAVLEKLQDDSETRPIPVVVLSADATQREMRRLRTAGARAFLTKPLDLAELLDVIQENLPAKEGIG